MTGYLVKFSFCVLTDRDGIEGHKHAKKNEAYPAILTEQAWSITNPRGCSRRLLFELDETCLTGKRAGQSFLPNYSSPNHLQSCEKCDKRRQVNRILQSKDVVENHSDGLLMSWITQMDHH